MTVADQWYGLSGVSLEFGVALEGEQDGAHLVALGEDDLVEFALFELVEEAVQLSHRFADGRKLGVCDSDALHGFGHRSRDDRDRCGRTDGIGVDVLSALSATLRFV